MRLDCGLSVAFLDGTFDAEYFSGGLTVNGQSSVCGHNQHYTPNDLAVLRKQVEGWEGDIDFFFTCEWPKGIGYGVNTSSIPGKSQSSSSAVC